MRDGLLEHRLHLGLALDDRVQREVPRRVLHDHLRRAVVGDVIVPPLADRDALVELVAAEQRLAELQQVAFAFERDAELLAHRAGAAVAADEILRPDLGRDAGGAPHRRGDAVAVLRERQEFVAVAHRDRRHAFRRSISAAVRACIARSADRARAAACRRGTWRCAPWPPPPRDADDAPAAARPARTPRRCPSGSAPAGRPRAPGRRAPCAGRFPWCGRCTAPSWAGTPAPPSARSGSSARRAARDRWRASVRSARRRR